MRKAQSLVLFLALALFGGLYLGFDTKPVNHKTATAERPMAQKGEQISFESILTEAKSHITADQTKQIADSEQQLAAATSDQDRIRILKTLSGFWYNFNQKPAAGGFADQAAEIERSDSAWSIAGATYYESLMAATDPAIRSYCADHAVHAFEQAAAANPGKVEHQVNVALVYAENPPPDNPMRAVLMLRDLESKHSDNAAVYNALGRLAIKTGQWQKAVDRLEKARTLDKNNPNTPCLLAKAYEGLGQMDKSASYAKLCK
jgi:predicted Zn-dependent protease